MILWFLLLQTQYQTLEYKCNVDSILKANGFQTAEMNNDTFPTTQLQPYVYEPDTASINAMQRLIMPSIDKKVSNVKKLAKIGGCCCALGAASYVWIFIAVTILVFR